MAIVKVRKIIPLASLDEINGINQKGDVFGIGFSIPSRALSNGIENKIYQFAQSIIDKMNIDTTAFLMSCRVTDKNELKLIEIHLDFGGDLILDQLIPNSTDEDILNIMISTIIDFPKKEFNIKYNPTAIIYEHGKELVTEKNFYILNANTVLELQNKIKEFCLKNSN
jgi:hypothetical protein